jgi:hypothetical protein
VLHCDVFFRQNVTFFAACLGIPIGIWDFSKQQATKESFQLFYFYETAQQTASIFLSSQRNIIPSINGIVTAPSRRQ